MNDDRLQQYLWDPAASPAPEAEDLERRLAPLRFDPRRRPLETQRLPLVFRSRGARWRRPLVAFAVAAALLIATGAGLWSWRWRWPEGRPWTVSAGAVDLTLQVGQPVTIPSADNAIANIARIGTMRLGTGTSIELRATRGRRHRLRLNEGDVHVRVWAPPGSIVIETPAGDVIDLGCEFRLSVREGRSAVQVLSGWVHLENGLDEVLVPAGASTEMTDTSGPGVPVFDDAPEGFREAVRGLEAGAERGALDSALALARARDVYTLLYLADRHPELAAPLLRRAAELWPPPGDVTIGGVLRGDRRALWRWANSLPLPPPKTSWWKNWRDALPFWLSDR
jgi:ferric-dicitrate binding protein FerR (iron transport regulator)